MLRHIAAASFAVGLALNAGAFEINLPVHFDTLANGLRIITVPDTNVAVVSCRLYYFVGSMYEAPGKTGLSHMFEHMMFKGTERLGTTGYAKERGLLKTMDSLEAIITARRSREGDQHDSIADSLFRRIYSLTDQERRYIKKDEQWGIYLENGATNLNAWTGDDMTAYIVTLPMNKVEVFYWIESDRMRDPILREFYPERDVVAEERRMRYDNRPFNKYWEQLWTRFFIAHPYRLPTIGWMSDIEAFTRKKLEEHVRKYYTPDNALIVLVGNINSVKAVADINRYFGNIPRAALPKEEVVTREPAAIGQTRFVVHDNAEPRIDLLFHTPGYPDSALYVLDVAEGILSGRSGRLFSRLVTKEQSCTNAGAGNSFLIHNGYFQVWATLKETTDPSTVEKILLEEIATLSKSGPTDREMLRIKNTIRMSFTSDLTSLERLSDNLAWFERLGNWKDLLDYPAKIAAVTPQQVAPVVRKYLNPGIMTVGMLLPVHSETQGATPHPSKKENAGSGKKK